MFRLCQGLGSGEAAKAVRQDMAVALTGQEKKAITMNLYFQALVDSGCLNQAMEFVKDTDLKVCLVMNSSIMHVQCNIVNGEPIIGSQGLATHCYS